MNIDDGLLQAAKAHALSSGRNVSDIVRDLLAREVGWCADKAPAALDDAGARPVLLAYSEGKISRRQAMRTLDLAPERHGEFVEAMNRLSVTWPKADPGQIEREADIVVRAIREAAGDAD
jgi:negative regulator of replication initiation